MTRMRPKRIKQTTTDFYATKTPSRTVCVDWGF